MLKKYVLVISDDPDNAEKISTILNHDDYLTVCCENCGYAKELNKSNNFSLMIYDAKNGLPDEARKFSEYLNIPLLALCRNITDIPTGIHALTRPYKNNRLIREVNSIYSREPLSDSKEVFEFGNISFCLSSGNVTKAGQKIHLSSRETDLLSYLCLNADITLSKEEIMSAVWKSSLDSSTVNVHILKLRKKLEDNPDRPKYIRTVHGKGFVLKTKP
ncbi:MAG: winged helix-turn-helix domain-containing protein [Oscillospiraceae bacterium]